MVLLLIAHGLTGEFLRKLSITVENIRRIHNNDTVNLGRQIM